MHRSVRRCCARLPCKGRPREWLDTVRRAGAGGGRLVWMESPACWAPSYIHVYETPSCRLPQRPSPPRRSARRRGACARCQQPGPASSAPSRRNGCSTGRVELAGRLTMPDRATLRRSMPDSPKALRALGLAPHRWCALPPPAQLLHRMLARMFRCGAVLGTTTSGWVWARLLLARYFQRHPRDRSHSSFSICEARSNASASSANICPTTHYIAWQGTCTPSPCESSGRTVSQ
jgi:hypothetical protein